MLIYQRQYARHYVLAQMVSRLGQHRHDRYIVIEVARPNDVSATLDRHIQPSLDGGGLCASSS